MRGAGGQKQSVFLNVFLKRLAAPLNRMNGAVFRYIDCAIKLFRRKILDRSWIIPISPSCVLVFAGFRHKTRPVIRLSAFQAAGTIYTSCNGVPYIRIPPKVVGAPEDLSRELCVKVADGPASPLRAAAIKLHRAAVMAGGVVMTADGKVVEESLINTQFWRKFGIFERHGEGDTLWLTQPSFSSRRRIGSGPCVLIKQNWDANYGHWLIEGLPRVALAAEHFDLGQLRFIIADGHGLAMEQVYKDSLAAFGIGSGQLIFLDWETVCFDELIYPLPMTAHPWTKSLRVVQVLEDLAARYHFDLEGAKRIYVSRNKTSQRRLVNEDAILEIVSKLGFVAVCPEALAFREQVQFFRSAEYIIGNYGAALTNLVFAPRKVSVLALTSQFMQDDFIWDLTSLKDGNYTSLHGKALQPHLGYHSDFEIDLVEFEAMLACIGL